MAFCRMAPSACNSQPWRFVGVTDPDLKDQVAETPNWLSKMGGSVKNKEYYLMDVGVVADHFCLQAADLGLGTCMLGWFDEGKVRALLNIPEKRRIPLLFTFGYPEKEEPRKKIRKPDEEVFGYNRY